MILWLDRKVNFLFKTDPVAYCTLFLHDVFVKQERTKTLQKCAFPPYKGLQQCLLFFKRQIKGQKHPICLWENAVEFLCRYSFHRIYTESAHLSIFVTENTTIPNINEVKENMTMGTTLVVNPDGSGFLVGNICGCVLHCYFSHC